MTIINRSSIILALLKTILVVGGVFAGFSQAMSLFPNAYAHTFTPDDSASFVALIYRIKNEAQLVQDNLLGNTSTTSSDFSSRYCLYSYIGINSLN